MAQKWLIYIVQHVHLAGFFTKVQYLYKLFTGIEFFWNYLCVCDYFCHAGIFYALLVNQMAHHEAAPPWCLCHCLGDKTGQTRVKQVAHPRSAPPIRWQRTPADSAGPNSATHHMLHEPRCVTLLALSYNTPPFCISSPYLESICNFRS